MPWLFFVIFIMFNFENISMFKKDQIWAKKLFLRAFVKSGSNSTVLFVRKIAQFDRKRQYLIENCDMFEVSFIERKWTFLIKNNQIWTETTIYLVSKMTIFGENRHILSKMVRFRQKESFSI